MSDIDSEKLSDTTKATQLTGIGLIAETILEIPKLILKQGRPGRTSQSL